MPYAKAVAVVSWKRRSGRTPTIAAASKTALLCRSVKYTCDAQRESYINNGALASLNLPTVGAL